MNRSLVHRIVVLSATILHRLYKITLSPLLGNACRFTPFCSDYALEAIKRHGLVAGMWLALKRVCRCHPWHQGGSDPVPQKMTGNDCERTRHAA